jgi:chorismate synthase
MAGRVLRLTLFGESHGCCVGVVIEGVPPGIPVNLHELESELARRRPGGPLASPRHEMDRVKIVSGVYRGYTTGAPIAVLVENTDVDSSFYERTVRWRPRPGRGDHAARIAAMGFEDYRGGGYHSGRITVGMVVAGYFARKILDQVGVSVAGYLRVLGGIECSCVRPPIDREKVYESPVRCPCPRDSARMLKALEKAIDGGGSVGGLVEVHAYNVPIGLGEPHFHGLDVDLAAAIMSVPGVKGVEFGEGFRLAYCYSSDLVEEVGIRDGDLTSRDVGGGFEAGYSASRTLIVRAAVRPTPTVKAPRKTIDYRGLEEAVVIGEGRHDPAIAIRAVPVIEAVTALVLADHILLRAAKTYLHVLRVERGLLDLEGGS